MEFVQRFLSFEKLIAPTLIKIVYWIGIAVVILGCLASGVGMMGYNAAQGLLIIVLGIPIGVIFWRFWCEIILVTFGVYDRLGEIRDKLGPKAP
jgi:hypothetical protein